MKTRITGESAELSLSAPIRELAALIKSIDDVTGSAELLLTLPKQDLARVMKAMSNAMAAKDSKDSNDHQAREVNEHGEELYSVEEAFPDGYPGMALRGLRGKEDLTQKELAERIGATKHRVSEMESGKRPISREMAKRIGKEFNVSYTVFL
ncbi:MAG: helix-turn-helix domain-containing protein [Deltaproteobacteria bacterium]|nr:helix-turn-helix domain-containing protein [Deltaproteobacteria bacterium]